MEHHSLLAERLARQRFDPDRAVRSFEFCIQRRGGKLKASRKAAKRLGLLPFGGLQTLVLLPHGGEAELV